MKNLFLISSLLLILTSCSISIYRNKPVRLWFDKGVCYQEWSNGKVTETKFGNPKSVKDCGWG